MKGNFIDDFYYKSYEKDANYIKGWKNMTKTELANGYCDAEECGKDELKGHYFSALMCKYWHMVTYLYDTSKSTRLDFEDFQFWISESLMVGFKYRRWRDPNYSVYYDKNGAEKVFNQCITSTRQRYYKHFNQDKRKINFCTYSLEESIEDYRDSAYGIEDLTYSYNHEYGTCKEVIEYYISKGKILEAMIIDGICFQNTQKHTKQKFTSISLSGEEITFNKVESEFSSRELVKMLLNLNESYIEYFLDKYKVNSNMLIECVNKIRNTKSTKLHKYINDTIVELKSNKEVRELLCC